jgi:ribosomal protein S27E
MTNKQLAWHTLDLEETFTALDSSPSGLKTGEAERRLSAVLRREMGKIATLIEETEKVKSQLQKQILDLGKKLGLLAVSVGALTIILGLILSISLEEIFLFEGCFEKEYGYFRPIVKEVVERYLDCGNPKCGFARIRCPDCAGERLVMFSCRTRGFCSSCHAKRLEEWGEWMRQTLLLDVPHGQVVFTIPKRLRVFFKFNRRFAKVAALERDKGK